MNRCHDPKRPLDRRRSSMLWCRSKRLTATALLALVVVWASSSQAERTLAGETSTAKLRDFHRQVTEEHQALQRQRSEHQGITSPAQLRLRAEQLRGQHQQLMRPTRRGEVSDFRSHVLRSTEETMTAAAEWREAVRELRNNVETVATHRETLTSLVSEVTTRIEKDAIQMMGEAFTSGEDDQINEATAIQAQLFQLRTAIEADVNLYDQQSGDHDTLMEEVHLLDQHSEDFEPILLALGKLSAEAGQENGAGTYEAADLDVAWPVLYGHVDVEAVAADASAGDIDQGDIDVIAMDPIHAAQMLGRLQNLQLRGLAIYGRQWDERATDDNIQAARAALGDETLYEGQPARDQFQGDLYAWAPGFDEVGPLADIVLTWQEFVGTQLPPLRIVRNVIPAIESEQGTQRDEQVTQRDEQVTQRDQQGTRRDEQVTQRDEQVTQRDDLATIPANVDTAKRILLGQTLERDDATKEFDSALALVDAETDTTGRKIGYEQGSGTFRQINAATRRVFMGRDSDPDNPDDLNEYNAIRTRRYIQILEERYAMLTAVMDAWGQLGPQVVAAMEQDEELRDAVDAQRQKPSYGSEKHPEIANGIRAYFSQLRSDTRKLIAQRRESLGRFSTLQQDVDDFVAAFRAEMVGALNLVREQKTSSSGDDLAKVEIDIGDFPIAQVLARFNAAGKNIAVFADQVGALRLLEARLKVKKLDEYDVEGDIGVLLAEVNQLDSAVVAADHPVVSKSIHLAMPNVVGHLGRGLYASEDEVAANAIKALAEWLNYAGHTILDKKPEAATSAQFTAELLARALISDHYAVADVVHLPELSDDGSSELTKEESWAQGPQTEPAYIEHVRQTVTAGH